MDVLLYFVSVSRHNSKDQIDGASRRAAACGRRVEVIELEGRKLTAAELKQTLEFWNPAGCIDSCGEWPNPLPCAAFGDLPVVHIDRDVAGFWGMPRHSAVIQDSEPAGLIAAKEMLSLGIKHFGYADYYRKTFWSADRLRGFRKALAFAGCACKVFPVAEAGAKRLAALGKWLVALPRPVGVFAVTDFVALEVLAAAARASIDVPGDLAVVGVDNDIVSCENAVPTLSSVKPDFESAGVIAADLLFEMIADPRMKPQCRTFGRHYLVRRLSTRRDVYADAALAQAVEWIRRHACEPIGVADVAAEMGCSRRSAEMRFRAVGGTSILNEIRAARLANAFELLRRPRQAIGTIANLCGYDSDVTLRRIVFAATGLTPREWRRQNGII